MVGGNDFISVRQIVDSNAKIKMMSLLKYSKLLISMILLITSRRLGSVRDYAGCATLQASVYYNFIGRNW